MTARVDARRVVLGGLALGLGVGVGLTPTASAQELGFGWEGQITDSRFEDGYEVTGDLLRVPVEFEYANPDSVITNLTLELESHNERCPDESYVQPWDEGDGDGADEPAPPTTPDTDPTMPPPTSPDDLEPPSARWTFAVEPRCNGVYDLRAYAEADPTGPAQPGDPGTVSGDIEVDELRVSLVAPPASVEAVVGPDRKVTIRWTAPVSWTDDDGAPDDAIGFRVQRVGADGNFVAIGETGPSGSSIVDDDLITARSGRFTYRVHTMRAGASGSPIASEPKSDEVDFAAATATPTTVTVTTTVRPGAGGAAAGGGAARGGGGVVAPPATSEFDPGFEEELPYDAELGAPDAVPPADIGIFEDDGPIGAGVLVPAAVALCLAVWAGHLRHLSHRASGPTS